VFSYIYLFHHATGVEPIWDQIAAHHLEVAVHMFGLTVSFPAVICDAMMILMMVTNCSLPIAPTRNYVIWRWIR
jgi:hypothetical protein